MADPIRVLVVEDHAVLRQSLVQLLGDQEDIELVGSAASGRDAVDDCRRLKPDVVIVDYSLPGLSGSEAAKQICSHCPGVRVIGYTLHDEPDVLEEMKQAGVATIVRKDADLAELLEEVRRSL